MIPQFSQLFIYSPDKSSSVCKIFISNPTLDKEQSLGRLFGIIEVESVDRALWDTVENLAVTVERSYYGEESIHIDPSRPNRAISVSDTFEKAIQHFNDRLIDLIKGGKLAALIDKMHIIIGVLKGSDVYFGAVGNVSSFLVHQLKSGEYRLIDIIATTGNREEKLNPFKVLSNIVSGQVEQNDSLLFCTNSLLDYLSLDKIKQTVTTLEPANATRHLKDLLLEASINTAFAGVLIKLISTTAQSPVRRTIELPQRSLDNLLHTEQATEQYLSPPLKFNALKYSRLISEHLKRAGIKSATTAKAYWQHRQQQRAVRQHEQQKQVVMATERPIQPTQPTTQPVRPAAAPRPTPAPVRRARQPWWPIVRHWAQRVALVVLAATHRFFDLVIDLAQQLTEPQASWRLLVKNKYQLLTRWLAQGLRQFFALPRQQQALGIIGVLLVAMLASNLATTGQREIERQRSAVFASTVGQINEQFATAEGALIYEDEERATTAVAEAKAALAGLTTTKRKEKNTVDQLQQKLSELTRKLSRITPVTITELGTLNGEAITIQRSGDLIFTINSADNAVARWSGADGLKLLEVKAATPQIKYAAGDLLYYHGGNGLVRLDPTKQTFSEAASNLAVVTGAVTDITLYQRRLYILSAAQKQIYRLYAVGSGFGKAEPWLREPADLSQAISIAVDGDIYALYSDGRIDKFSAGKHQDYTARAIEPALTNPRKIFVTNTQLYILDPSQSRIVVLVKGTGNLVAQYTNDSFSQLKDLALDEKNKLGYALVGNRLVRFPL